ncbi:GLPGLI family protein [Halpernia sp.]|uniref:GLPGLI family protein n=1 Tax=Halpernia sp. TaxID=2782209 RepID=UPI003A92335C
MKAILTFFFFSISTLLFSQHRFVYQLKFKIDSTDKTNIQTENFNLDIKDNASFFYSTSYAEYDSLTTANKISGITTQIKIEPKLDFLIKKNYITKEIVFNELLGMDNFQVIEPRKMKWEISQDFKTLDNYKVQKAETTFAGRTWICWFAQDIPFSDGPYKFSGLPGLIVEAYDSKEDFHFTLIQIVIPQKTFISQFYTNFGIRTIDVSYDEYIKKKKQIDADPTIFLKQMPGLDKISSSDLLEIQKDFVSSYRNKQKLRNNKIELSD